MAGSRSRMRAGFWKRNTCRATGCGRASAITTAVNSRSSVATRESATPSARAT